MDSKDPILINKLRDKLVDEMTTNSELYDEYDLERVKSNDWTLQRFLSATKVDLENAFIMARDAMKWRKSYGVNSKTDLDFPLEFYKIGAVFAYCEDREGRVVIYLRIKLYKPFPTFSDYFKQFLIHIINKIDIQSGDKGFAMVWDVTGVGPSNWDLSMIRFINSSLRNYFSGGLTYLAVYNIPWIMNPFISIGLKIVSEEKRNKIKILKEEQIFEFIEPTNVPDFMGGKCQISYREIPKGVRYARDIGAERGISLKEVENILKYYENYLN